MYSAQLKVVCNVDTRLRKKNDIAAGRDILTFRERERERERDRERERERERQRERERERERERRRETRNCDDERLKGVQRR